MIECTACTRSEGYPIPITVQRKRVFAYVGLALLGSEVIGVGLLVGLNIIQSSPQYVILISGMIIGNAMVVASLQWNRIQNDMRNRAAEVEVLLSLGFSSEQASAPLVKKWYTPP